MQLFAGDFDAIWLNRRSFDNGPRETLLGNLMLAGGVELSPKLSVADVAAVCARKYDGAARQRACACLGGFDKRGGVVALSFGIIRIPVVKPPFLGWQASQSGNPSKAFQILESSQPGCRPFSSGSSSRLPICAPVVVVTGVRVMRPLVSDVS